MEEWRDIIGYEDLYQVSNLGNIKSLKRIDLIGRIKSEKILKPVVNETYFRVTLYKNGRGKCFLIHRLVAEHFIKNDNCLPCVNHKDEDTFNNNSQNLEWCTYEYNNKYGSRIERVVTKCKNGKRSIPVIAVNISSEEIKIYPSMSEAERITGVKCGNISNCCRGKQKSAGGFIWKLFDCMEENNYEN